MKLLEFFNIITEAALLESRLDFLKNSFGEKLEAQSKLPVDQIFNQFVDADPTPQKKYVQWLIRLYLKGNMPLEDLYKASDYITLFLANVRNMEPSERDINQYKSLPEMYAVVRPIEQEKVDFDNRMHTEESEVVYDTPSLMVVIPETREASCYLGKGTEWCTASESDRHNQFDYYNDEGHLYIIIDKTSGNKYQLHFPSRSLMDASDTAIPVEELIRKVPEIRNAFKEWELDYMRTISVVIRERGVTDEVSERISTVMSRADLPVYGYDEHEEAFRILSFGTALDMAKYWYTMYDNVANVLTGRVNPTALNSYITSSTHTELTNYLIQSSPEDKIKPVIQQYFNKGSGTPTQRRALQERLQVFFDKKDWFGAYEFVLEERFSKDVREFKDKLAPYAAWYASKKFLMDAWETEATYMLLNFNTYASYTSDVAGRRLNTGTVVNSEFDMYVPVAEIVAIVEGIEEDVEYNEGHLTGISSWRDVFEPEDLELEHVGTAGFEEDFDMAVAWRYLSKAVASQNPQ